jgi:hypothetical protein
LKFDRRFGGTRRLHLHCWRVCLLPATSAFLAWLSLANTNMVDSQRTTRHYIPEYRILHNQLFQKLKILHRIFVVILMRGPLKVRNNLLFLIIKLFLVALGVFTIVRYFGSWICFHHQVWKEKGSHSLELGEQRYSRTLGCVSYLPPVWFNILTALGEWNEL